MCYVYALCVCVVYVSMCGVCVCLCAYVCVYKVSIQRILFISYTARIFVIND